MFVVCRNTTNKAQCYHLYYSVDPLMTVMFEYGMAIYLYVAKHFYFCSFIVLKLEMIYYDLLKKYSCYYHAVMTTLLYFTLILLYFFNLQFAFLEVIQWRCTVCSCMFMYVVLLCHQR